MRGSMAAQCCGLLNQSGILRIGKSKHAEQTKLREELKALGLSADRASVGRLTGMFNGESAHQYLSSWIGCAQYAKEIYGIKDIEKLAAEHIASWLEFRIECGAARSTVYGDLAALSKLEAALSTWADTRESGREYDFKEAVSAAREEARTLPSFEGSRAYSDVPALITAIYNDTTRLAVQILSESGCRIAEGTEITAWQLKELSVDRYTGAERGVFAFIGKGGRVNVGHLSPTTYDKLQRHITLHGTFSVSQYSVRETLKKAAHVTEQHNGYTGAHGLRWSFAQSRMDDLQAHSISRDEALAVVSSEMGHNRPEITELYLR